MKPDQEWRTESYKSMDIHVSALLHTNEPDKWDYTVRVAYPGTDAGTSAELAAGAGDDDDYADAEQAIAAGLEKGHAMVDRLIR